MSYKPTRILVWDDRNTAAQAVREWLDDIPSHQLQLTTVVLWSEAVRQLLHEGPWDIVVADLLDDTYIGTKLSEYQRAWQECMELSVIREMRSSPFGALKAELWQAGHFWGTGLLLLANACRVPEIFVLSGYVLSGNVGAQAKDADAIVISLCNAGVIKGGVLDKLGSSWSRTQLRNAVLNHTEDTKRPVPNKYELTLASDEASSRTTRTNRTTWPCHIVERKSQEDGYVYLDMDEIVILRMLSDAEGASVSGDTLLQALNKQRCNSLGFSPLTQAELRDLMMKLNIQLVGEHQPHPRSPMCRRDNDILCPWRRGEVQVPRPQEEGYSCYEATRTAERASGYCPKTLNKSASVVPLDAGGGASRRKIMYLREKLKALDSKFDAGFSGPEGLVRTIGSGPRGYALAGQVEHGKP